MRADTAGSQEVVSLPLSFVIPAAQGDFPQKAKVFFHKSALPEVISSNYTFKGPVLSHQSEKKEEEFSQASLPGIGVPLPVFSILAVILLIVFRNIFFSSFTKYFLSIRNNYEIDFNLQKIGVPSLVMALLIILLPVLDLVQQFRSASLFFLAIKVVQLLLFPMMISSIILFLFSLSIRFFPLIFPDIKVLFFLALLLLLHNFSFFSLQGNMPEQIQYFLPALIALFFILRSILIFLVLRKFFRYRSALSLFYICTLNLSTSMVLFKVLN
jgi:hypothetical protein